MDGDGPHCVVAGTLCAARHWRDFGYAATLARNWRVINVDPLGHGASDTPHDADAYDCRRSDGATSSRCWTPRGSTARRSGATRAAAGWRATWPAVIPIEWTASSSAPTRCTPTKKRSTAAATAGRLLRQVIGWRSGRHSVSPTAAFRQMMRDRQRSARRGRRDRRVAASHPSSDPPIGWRPCNVLRWFRGLDRAACARRRRGAGATLDVYRGPGAPRVVLRRPTQVCRGPRKL